MYLAVYGTLRKGLPLHYLLKKFNARFIGFGLTDPSFKCYYDVYPICQKGGRTKIFVEVYELDEEALETIDIVEAGYVREIVRVYIDSSTLDAYIYLYREDSDIPKSFTLFEGALFNFIDIIKSK